MKRTLQGIQRTPLFQDLTLSMADDQYFRYDDDNKIKYPTEKIFNLHCINFCGISFLCSHWEWGVKHEQIHKCKI